MIEFILGAWAGGAIATLFLCCFKIKEIEMPNKFGEYIVPAYTWNDEQTAIEKGYTEVIRCKDCVWNREKEWVDCYMSGMHGRNINNFCSRAQRKEE